MNSGLTEEQLRQSLQVFGEDVGPITPTTRALWERRLQKLQKGSRKSGSPLNSFSSDDSELENNSSPHSTRRKRASIQRPPRISVGRRSVGSHAVPLLPTVQRTSRRSAANFDVEISDSDGEVLSGGVRARRRSRKSDNLEPSEVHDATTNFLRKEAENAQQRFSERLDSISPDNIVTQSNGYLSKGAEFEKSTNHNQCVSWLLLLGAGLFFVVIGMLYMQTTAPSNAYSKLCQGQDLLEEDCQIFIQVSHSLYDLLAKRAGNYDCGSNDQTSTRNVSISEAKSHLWDQLKETEGLDVHQFNKLFELSVELLKKDEKFEVIVGDDGNSLEAQKGAKTLWCRFTHSLHFTFSKILMFVGGCLCLVLMYAFIVFYKKWKEHEEKEFFEMVEKVIDIMQQRVDFEDNGSPFRAVIDVRNELIPAHERKSKSQLWNRVVFFIEEKESRISVEFQTINGEDFKVWRWNSHRQNDSGRHERVWQGQAFFGTGKIKNGPTPCLKIKNMFDKDVEYGPDWEIAIQDAILEKCEGNDGILHIGIETSGTEGFVYMLCNSTEAAGKAHFDLHGWWFDGKLVTAKYLQMPRYAEHFPEYGAFRTPLRPSNDRRRSLSAPFHSSALEIS